LTDSSTAGDEVLAPAIYDFLALMQDSDHVGCFPDAYRLHSLIRS
jgi:hypothetical protein